jgi:hypothetical protein
VAANLNPSKQAIYPEVLGMVKSMVDAIPAQARQTPQGRRERQ